MGQSDKRSSPRLTIRDDVMLVIPGAPGHEICILENICIHGVKFFCTQQLAVDGVVELHVPAPDDEPPIIIHGTIIRADPGAHGKPYSYACVIEDTENA